MRKILFIAAAISMALFIVSCATSPKKGEESAKTKAQTEKGKAKEEKSTAKVDKGKNDGDFKASAESLQVEAETLMGKAKAIKADVAMREEFGKAQAAYDEALKYKNGENYKKAAKSFGEAKGLFAEVYAKTEEKRARAAKSIEESQKELQSVEEKARAAGLS
jgi:hypothetical protein